LYFNTPILISNQETFGALHPLQDSRNRHQGLLEIFQIIKRSFQGLVIDKALFCYKNLFY